MDSLDDLLHWLRIPSISSDPAYQNDTRKAAEFTAHLLRQGKLENVDLIESPGRHPLVYGEWLHAPGKPTLLFYGHYDVQPPEPLEEWTSPPFEPVIRGENLYARGAADDKGLLYILIRAVSNILARGNSPVNLKFLIEGEEESGGEHITEFVASGDSRLKADAVIIADTEMFAPELPTICVGLRGIVYGEIHVEASRQDLHSGVYGGVAPNPIQAIAEIITTLKNRDGHITIPGFYDRVQPPTVEEKRAWARLPFDEKKYLGTEIGAPALTGEPGFSVFEKTWARPTFEVHGIRGGFTGEGAKTVIPAKAVAKISVRTVPHQRNEEVVEQLTSAVARATPQGVYARYVSLHTGEGSLVDPRNAFVQAAALAMTEIFRKETVFTRGGGSIPIVSEFEKHLGIPSVLIGFGLPDDNIHAPNEKLYLPNLHRGILATERLIELSASL